MDRDVKKLNVLAESFVQNAVTMKASTPSSIPSYRKTRKKCIIQRKGKRSSWIKDMRSKSSRISRDRKIFRTWPTTLLTSRESCCKMCCCRTPKLQIWMRTLMSLTTTTNRLRQAAQRHQRLERIKVRQREALAIWRAWREEKAWHTKRRIKPSI